MSKVRVYEVAKQLNMDQKTLVALFQSMGVGDVRNHMSAVEPDAVERVKRHLERQKTPDVVEERIRPTVLKRRAKTGDGEVPHPRPSEPGTSFAAAPSSPGILARPDVPPPPPSAPAMRVPDARPSSTGMARRPIAAPRPSEPGSLTPPIRPEPAPKVMEPVRAEAPPEPVAPPPVPAPAELPATKAAPRAPETAAEAPKPAPVEVKPEAPAPVVEAPIVAPPVVVPAVEQQARAEAAAPVEPAPPKPEPLAAKPEVAPEPVAAPVVKAAEAPAPAPAEVKESAPPVTVSSQPPAPVSAPKPRAEAAPVSTPTPSGPRSEAVPPIRRAAQSRTEAAPTTQRAPSPPARPAEDPQSAPRRPSSPPKTGIDVWQGRPGVPMPPPPRTGTTPPARRTTYDPRAASAQSRPTVSFGPQSRQPNSRGRPGFRQGQGGGPQRPGAQQAGRKPSQVSTAEMASYKKVIKIEEQVSLQKLASMMSVKATDVLVKLLSMGMPGVNINTTLDADTAKIIASEFGWSVEDVAVSEADTLATATAEEGADDANLGHRPPVVTVMGHVDHGKTSLLDRIRKANVAEGEAGGITQHVGAYRVETPRGTVAFLDTPGHEAFTAMRARGASLTDIVILVVAADDGVMPQTREAISHAQAAKVPLIVAVNKMDKAGAEPDKVKRDLANLGLTPEEWGGETLYVGVSAKTGMGIEELLEAVLLQAEVLELKANPKRRASGTVIEALLDRGRGPVARVMVQDGMLRVGDILLAGSAWGKVRAMTDELGRQVGEAGPSTPVEVLGLNEVPSAGDPVHSVKDAKTAEEIADTRRKKAVKSLIPQDSRVSLESLTKSISESEQLELKLIIKGDVQGSVEAVVHALTKLSGTKVKVTVVHAAVGGITEGDVNLAVAAKAIIVGFNVRPAGKAAASAETEGVEIRLYNIIYNAVDDIRSAMEGLLPATKVERTLGRAEVRQVFRIAKAGAVAGCMVLDGLVRRTADARLVRDSKVVWTGKLSGLRRFKDDAKEVAEGFECGISLEGYQDVKESDIIESFEIEEQKTKLV